MTEPFVAPGTDDLVREFCRENDIGQIKGCPKCGLEAKTMLFPFCQHAYCPIREWQGSKK